MKVPPERPCGEQCGGLGAQSPHQTGRVFLPDADENAPGTFSGAEMQINGAAFFKQSFESKIKGDLIWEAAAEENGSSAIAYSAIWAIISGSNLIGHASDRGESEGTAPIALLCECIIP